MKKARKIIRNVYDGENGPKNGRYQVFFQDGNYCLKNGGSILALDPLNGKRVGATLFE